MDGARTFSIGSLAEAAGVSRRTVRFYVQGELLEPPVGLGRGAHYTEAHLARLMQIKSWQEQGVPLEAIRARLQDQTLPARGAGRREQRRADAAASSALNVTPGAAVPGRAWMRQPLLADYELHVAGNRSPLHGRAAGRPGAGAARHRRERRHRVRTQTAVAEPRSGAYAAPEGRPLPLEGVRVTAEISGAASRVVMAQRYRNAEAVPVEAVYVFPLPEGAALCGLLIETGGRRINGRVLEREEAFAAYDDALAAGHGAALLDEERPNVFTASVGNLLPGQELTVELTWVEALAREGDAIRFALPTVVAPRYVPDEDARGVSPTPGERVSPPVELAVPYGFSFAAEVELPGGVAGVESPTHPIRVLLADGKARVELAQEAAAMDRDLVLLLTPVAAAKPCGLLERQADGSVVAAVSFVPSLSRSGGPREVVFLVDRSGSMNGDSIEAVRRALQLCLRSLEEGDAFDVVGFGSTFQTLFGAPRPYAQASLEEASAHVERLQADLGGTEILPALRSVLERPCASGLRREVVLLTDGEVSNDDAVVALAREHAATTRVFAFGIGHAASEHLVRAVARASGGAAEMILPGRALEATVVRQFGRLRAAALEDVRVAWSGARAQLQAPATVAQLFDGEPLAVYAWLDGAPAAALLSATSAGKAVSWEVELDPEKVADGSLLGTLAARAAIRDLEEGTAEARRGSNQRDRAEKRVREEIVRLAVRYGLASRETSFVAVEEREAGEDRPAAELRRIPVALAHGWGGVEATRHQGVSSRVSPNPRDRARGRDSGERGVA